MKNILSKLRIKERYDGLSMIAKASFWFMVCGVLQRSISLLTTPIFTRMLTTAQYGQFTVYNSWLNLFSIITTLRLDYAVFNKGMSKYPDERDRYTSSMQGAANIITMIVFVFYLIFRNQINALTELSTVVTCFMFLELFFMPAIRFWTLRQRYDYRYKSVVFVTLALAVFNALFGVVAVSLTENKGVARIFSCIIVECCVGMCLYTVNLVRGKQYFNWKYVKFAILFNIPLIPYYFSGYILQQVDRLMIQKMSGVEDVAVYGIAYNVGLVMTIVSNSINSALAPWEYEMLRLGKYKKIPKQIYQIAVLVFAALGLFMAVAPEAVLILAGEKYAEATYIIPAITASVLFMTLSDVFGNIEFYHDKNKYATIVSVIIAVLNIGLNYIGIKAFGYIAAGYTTLICYLLAAVAHMFYVEYIMKKTYGEKLFNVKIIIGLVIAMLVLVAGITLLYQSTLLRYGIILIVFVLAIIKREKIMRTIKALKRKD